MHIETVDATNQTIGRCASGVATLLRGKNKASYDPSRLPDVRVHVEHAGALRVTGNKMTAKMYYRFSGYPGGLKQTQLRDLFRISPERVLKNAVANMLPKNRLRDRLLKRLTVTR